MCWPLCPSRWRWCCLLKTHLAAALDLDAKTPVYSLKGWNEDDTIKCILHKPLAHIHSQYCTRLRSLCYRNMYRCLNWVLSCVLPIVASIVVGCYLLPAYLIWKPEACEEALGSSINVSNPVWNRFKAFYYAADKIFLHSDYQRYRLTARLDHCTENELGIRLFLRRDLFSSSIFSHLCLHFAHRQAASKLSRVSFLHSETHASHLQATGCVLVMNPLAVVKDWFWCLHFLYKTLEY